MPQKIKFSNIFIVCMILAILALTMRSLVFAAGSSTDESSIVTDKVLYVSIYDEFSHEYLLTNTKLYITEDFTIVDTLQKLKEAKTIKDYAEFSDGSLASITFNDDTFRAVDNGAEIRAGFYIKLNGAKSIGDQLTRFAKNGDIIEVFYTNEQVWVPIDTSTNESSPQSSPEATNEGNKEVTSYWNADLVKTLSGATEWLNRSGDGSISYVTAMGIAGKSADVKAINELVNEIQKTTEYITPIEITQRILATTFCGFDASSSAYGQLLRQLYTYKDIMKDGIYGAIDTLIAYDSNNYEVEETALNSRKKMVDELLTYQQVDGGFGLSKVSSSDMRITAKTLTALSNYKSRSDVARAIDKAVDYLALLQLETGGYEYLGTESSEAIGTVIVALSSVGVDLEDVRFVKKRNTLLERFMEYNNADGGFADTIGGKGSFVSTQNAVIALTAVKKSANPYEVTTLVAQNEKKDTSSAATTDNKAESTIVIGASIAIVLILGVMVIARRITAEKVRKEREREQ